MKVLEVLQDLSAHDSDKEAEPLHKTKRKYQNQSRNPEVTPKTSLDCIKESQEGFKKLSTYVES